MTERSAIEAAAAIIEYLQSNGIQIKGEEITAAKSVDLPVVLPSGQARTLRIDLDFLSRWNRETIRSYCEKANIAAALEKSTAVAAIKELLK